eukprot:11481665-Alexandrium_andersonii.AAC.1
MSASLVGSEMCIRDRAAQALNAPTLLAEQRQWRAARSGRSRRRPWRKSCLLYTSDAADDM